MCKRNVFLTSKDVSLVLLEKDDAPVLLPNVHNPEVNIFIGRGEQPMTLQQEESWIENLHPSQTDLTLGIWHNTDKILIGSAGLHNINQVHQNASLGIIIGNKKYWSKGIGTDVLNTLCTYGFEIRNLRSIKLSVLSNNPRAIKCYAKCGFEQSGVHRAQYFKQGVWHDEILMIRYREK